MRNTIGKARPFLTLKDATFRLADRLIFQNLTWSYQRHEQWAIIGPNGSGKSVLADALRGRLPLVHGEMNYHFTPPNGLSPEEAIGHVAFEDRKSEVHGTVVQSRWTSFEEEGSLPVDEFLSYERVMDVNPFEVTPKHARARPAFDLARHRAIELMQIGGLLERTLLSLSNGERQRVELARALAQPLRLLILDEPYAGLDFAMRDRFHGVLERLLKTRLRVLLLTTRIDDLPRHITHLLRLEDCRVATAGPRSEVLAAAISRNGASSFKRRARVPPALRPKARRKETGRSHEPKPSLVEMRDVRVHYGSNIILHNLNWNVRAGESWALLGPNGSGKTTLLSLILGDHPQAYTNQVYVFGKRRGSGESIWQLKKRIGWVSPELQTHFDDSFSVLDVVLSGFHETIGLFEAPNARQQASARAWLRDFGLLEVAGQPLFSLSAGSQRMVLLARALVKKPSLLILDEPCQGLDPAHRDLIIERVDALIRTRLVTAIFVTHRPEEVPPSVRQVLCLTLSRRRSPQQIG